MKDSLTPIQLARRPAPTQPSSCSRSRSIHFDFKDADGTVLYAGKAKNIRRLSEILVAEHGGSVPDDLETLESLPGVGHKTASVVVSQGFGQPAFPVDTHIFRNARRWRLSRGKTVEAVEADLKAVFPRDTWNRRHLQIIYFGREYCPARGHEPATCPICSWANPDG